MPADPSLMTPLEIQFLGELARMAPAYGFILELGTYQGRSTAVLCEAVAPANRVISIDNYRMQHHQPNSLAITAGFLDEKGYAPLLIEADSTLPLRTMLAMLFIDSHHHPETLRKELAAHELLVVTGGIIALHDYGRSEYPGYTEAIDELLKPKYRLINQKGSLIAFQVLPSFMG